jgi:hypothetical protein
MKENAPEPSAKSQSIRVIRAIRGFELPFFARTDSASERRFSNRSAP